VQHIHSKINPLASRKIAVMIVDEQAARRAILEQALIDCGYRVISKLANADELLKAVNEQQPDIIIIDVDSPNRDMLEQMRYLSDKNTHPIVMFSEQDIPINLHRTIDAGVSLYVVDGLQPQLIQSIVEVAIARFREYQALRNELEKTRNELADRKIIERAKSILMEQKKCSEDTAYQLMRKMAMDKSQKITTIAQNIIEIVNLLDKTQSSL